MPDIFTFEALPARKGDSLIIYYGKKDNPKIAVIDGGPSKVYEPALRPRLFDIRAHRELEDTEALPIELLMISHIDDDHIKGILEMATELKEADDLSRPKYANVKTLWHNTFDDILDNIELSELDNPTLVSMGGGDLPEGVDEDAAFILTSVRQGRDLRNLANALNWETNNPFDPLVMMDKDDDPDVTRFGGELSFTILGPRRKELEDLQKKYDKFLRDNNLDKDSAEAALASTQDESVSNLSSIVALAELGGKRILLTGDALGTEIEKALEARGLASEATPLKVDILKLQHHGSDRNVTPSFFKKVKADHYVFCGDGAHGNPERSTIEMLFAQQGVDAITLHFTNKVSKVDDKRKSEKNKKAQKNKDKGKPFEFWDDGRDSLVKLFSQETGNGRPFIVVEPSDRTGIRIHLLDAHDVPRHDH